MESTLDPFLLIDRDGPVVTATMNRPEQRNALSTKEDMAALTDFCAEVSADTTIRAVVLTGAGPAFCAGGNVKDMSAKRGMFGGSPMVIRNGYKTGIQTIPMAFYELEVPVIAAVNGPAIGAGLDLTCMCDVRIASENAKFAESFVKLGIIPGDGGAWLLPRTIGLPNATLMTLTGDTIDAATALSYGLVQQVVPADQLLDVAKDIAVRIAANPGHSTRLAKRLLREGLDMKLPALLELSAAYQALAHHTRDHEEALAAMLEKRPAKLQDC
jgi:enoyl-CoA hydratase/carnithine racemase